REASRRAASASRRRRSPGTGGMAAAQAPRVRGSRDSQEPRGWSSSSPNTEETRTQSCPGCDVGTATKDLRERLPDWSRLATQDCASKAPGATFLPSTNQTEPRPMISLRGTHEDPPKPRECPPDPVLFARSRRGLAVAGLLAWCAVGC